MEDLKWRAGDALMYANVILFAFRQLALTRVSPFMGRVECRPSRRASDALFALSTTLAAVALSTVLLAFASLAAGAADTAPGVLIIHSNQRATPAAVVIENTLGSVVPERRARPGRALLRISRRRVGLLGGYAPAQAEFLRQKYGGRNIRVIVAEAPAALQFTLKFRDRILPGVPIVHVAVPVDQPDGASLPADVVGKSVDLDPTATLRFALRLQPGRRAS